MYASVTRDSGHLACTAPLKCDVVLAHVSPIGAVVLYCQDRSHGERDGHILGSRLISEALVAQTGQNPWLRIEGILF